MEDAYKKECLGVRAPPISHFKANVVVYLTYKC